MTPEIYHRNTSSKLPEFSVFYNYAYFRLAGYVYQLNTGVNLENSNISFDEKKDKIEGNLDAIISSSDDEKDKLIVAKLINYLWKGYNNPENAAGYLPTSEDRQLVKAIVKKLKELRNFHSHYYHEDTALYFDESLKKKIEGLHQMAMLSFAEKHQSAIGFYQELTKEFPLFKKVTHSSNWEITEEGRTFFLSFFLTTGEMSRFLQQRKGSKRNDKPQFKIKQLVYRYYCHRDGAARQHYSHEDTILDTMPQAEQKQILLARKASKLMIYLNDTPEVCFDTHLFPLYLGNEEVTSSSDFNRYCQLHGLFPNLRFSDVTLKPKLDKTKKKRGKAEEIVLENQLAISFKQPSSFVFHLNKYDVHRLILEAIRLGDNGTAIEKKLNQFIEEREVFPLLLEQDLESNDKLTLNDTLDQYYRFKLRNTYLQELLGEWLEHQEDKRKKAALLKKINISSIDLRFYDFRFEEDKKLRSEERFMEFAVSYLIDMSLVPNWLWLCTKKQIIEEQATATTAKKTGSTTTNEVSKLEKRFESKIPKGFQIAFTYDKQVVLGIKKDGDSDVPSHKFLLGHKAVKNLLICHFEGKNIQDFFEPIMADIDLVRQDSSNTRLDSFQILTKNELPVSFLKSIKETSIDINVLKAQGISRCESIIKDFEAILQKEIKLNDADKNRQIMRCYTFFDWAYPQDSKFKFLRKDEYKLMSVYHYCLKKRGKCNVSQLSKGQYAFLIEKALAHAPNEVKTLLAESESLSDLLDNTLKATLSVVENWKELIPLLSGKKLKTILARIGVNTNTQQGELRNCIPFDIHPSLVLRKYMPHALLEPSSIATSLRASLPQLGLDQTHYQYQAFLQETYLPEDSQKAKVIGRKLIGKYNDTLTKDILLWKITQGYMTQLSPIYKAFLGTENSDWKIHNVRQSELKLPLTVDNTTILLKVKYHQLDDFLFIETKPYIEKIVKSIKKNYAEDTPCVELEYEKVFKELQRIFNDAVEWAGYILKWEKAVVDKQYEAGTLSTIIKKNYLSFAEVMKVTTLSQAEKNEITEIREVVFHARIPDKSEAKKGKPAMPYWTYKEKAENEHLIRILGIEKREKRDYRIENV